MQNGKTVHYNDPAPNIFERGSRAKAIREQEESTRKNVVVENGHTDHHEPEPVKPPTAPSRRRNPFLDPVVPPVPRAPTRRDLQYFEDERKKREQEEAEIVSDGELSVEWNENIRDAEVAVRCKKINTKSQRRKSKIRPGGMPCTAAVLDEKLGKLEELGLPLFDRKKVEIGETKLYAELDRILASCLRPAPLYVARFMGVYRAPIGTKIQAKVTSCHDGLFCCSWKEIEEELDEYQKESDSSDARPGVDPWNIFPGNVMEVNTGPTDHPFQRGIIIEVFKRAQRVDMQLVEFGNKIVRVGPEQIRPVSGSIKRDSSRRWRKFCVCFYKLSEPSGEFESAMKARIEQGDKPEVVIQCERHEQRTCWGKMSFSSGLNVSPTMTRRQWAHRKVGTPGEVNGHPA